MKKIVCEMCSSNDVIKDGEFYVCQACGTKYTVESARSLLKDIGTLDIKGKVEIDSSNQVESLTAMANNALSLNNYKDALDYIEKILAIDPQNYNALFLKGKASDDVNDKYNAFSYALQCVPSEQESALIEDIKNQILEFYNQQIKEITKKYFIVDVIFERRGKELENALKIISSKFPTEILNEKIEIDKNAVLNPFLKRTYDYSKDQGYLDIKKLKIAADPKISHWVNPCVLEIKNLQVVLVFLKCIINYSTDIELKLNACNLFIDFSNNACTLQYSRAGSIYSYFIDESKIPALKQDASFYKTKTVELKREIENQRKAKIEKYWQEHSEEKKALDEEKERLTKELNEIKPIIAKTQAEIENVESGKKKMPADFIIESLEAEINNLTLERNKLGIFKGKQKAEIDKKIEEACKQKSQAKNALVSQRKELISELRKEHLPMCQRSLDIKSRLSEIEKELTKDRQ